MKNHLFIIMAVISLFSCSNGDKGPVHIRKNLVIGYYLNAEANQETEEAVIKTFQNWEKVTNFKFIYKGRNRAGLRRDGKNTISFLTGWPKNIPPGKVGWCENWFDFCGNITESDIIFNMTATRFTTLESNAKNSYYIEGVLSHEIGHMIGLGHINSKKSLMKETSSFGESFFKGKIDPETIQAYRKLYNIH